MSALTELLKDAQADLDALAVIDAKLRLSKSSREAGKLSKELQNLRARLEANHAQKE